MYWSEIDFKAGWFIERYENVTAYHAKALFEENLDLKCLLTLRKIVPDLQNRPISELKETMIGIREYILPEISNEDVSVTKTKFENAGINLKVTPQKYIREFPVYKKGKDYFRIEISDKNVHQELVGILKKRSVELLTSGISCNQNYYTGDKAKVIQDLLQLINFEPSAINLVPVDEKLVHFKYIDDAILPMYAKADECFACGEFRNVFLLLGEFIIDGEEVYAEVACGECIQNYEMTNYGRNETENSIRQKIDMHYEKGKLSEEERQKKTKEIFCEYKATPRLPNFIQYDDWPFCCGDFAVFIGDAGQSYNGNYDDFSWWGSQNCYAVEQGISSLINGEDRVSLFRCSRCFNKFWTWQST